MVIQRYCSSSSTTSFSFSLENFLAKGFETFQEKNIFQILKLKTIFLLDFFHQNIHSEFLPEPNIYNSYIYIYVAYSRQHGWTDWAKILCGHSWAGGVKG